MSSNPESDQEVDWPDEMEFNGNMVEMFPNGPTDFGIGPHARSGPEAIGGCDMEYSEAAARGYMYQPDDPRDIEYKMEMVFHNIDSGLSISADTARHTSSNCCQGNAYMANLDSNADGGSGDDQFRFRKEQWHVHYVDTGWFNHPDIDFSIQDHGKIGYGFCRYNKPNTPGHVILEMWLNPTPDTDKNNWIKIGEEEDFVGHGFGDAGDVCGGADDEPLTWGGPQSRTKSNSTGGSVEFTCISLREIDPTRDFDEPPPPPPTCPPGQIWDGTKCVDSSSGGGGTGPPTGGSGGTVQPIITYCMASSQTGNPFPTLTGAGDVGNTTRVLSEEIVECMINPDRFKRFGNNGWVRDSTFEGADIGDRPCDYVYSLDNIKIYPSGLVVETYWDESTQFCVCPGVGNGSAGGTRVQDTTLIMAIINGQHLNSSGSQQSNMDYLTGVIAHEIVEAATDPLPQGIDAESQGWTGWQNATPTETDLSDSEIADICGDPAIYGPGHDLWTGEYWSNSDANCVAPGISSTDLGTSTRIQYYGGRVLDTAKIYLIFWGSNWKTRTSPATAAQLVTQIQSKMLGTHANYFDKLTQYGVTNRPAWGGVIYNTEYPIPSGIIPFEKLYGLITDTITRGLTPRPPEPNQNIYIGMTPWEHAFEEGDFYAGFHSFIYKEPLTSPSGNPLVALPSSVDANGIEWKQATGEIIGWGNSRDNPDDFRWSHDTENAGLGYEVTWIVKCNNIDLGDGHTALKCGGPNHSGDCGGHPELKEGSTCCCWYDLGIRSNGDIQTQIERPHPTNTDWDCDECTMTNIGVNMEDHWIGMKLILYPEKPGGTSDDGGIHIKMYVDNDAITGTTPNNNWDLVVDMMDHGDILGNYDWPLYQELEMRLSGVNDINDVEMYKDQVFMRRLTDTDPGTGGGGGGNTDGVYNHGGRMMHNPKLQVIYWGADWNTRSADPTKAQVTDMLQNKLLGTNDEFFDKLSQYGNPGVPTWLTPVVNTTVTYPADGKATVPKIEEVIKHSLESGLCPVPTDFLNTIFVVLPEVNHYILVPSSNSPGGPANILDQRYRDCFKPVITLPGGGGGGGTGSQTTVQGVFKFMRDIDVVRVSACQGGTDEGGGGGGGGSGSSIFYNVPETDNEKQLCNDASQDNRTRITQRVVTSGSDFNGKKITKADVPLRKIGSVGATPVINFKIWDNLWNVVYTSPTTFAPNALATSFPSSASYPTGYSSFDCSTNTHVMVVGDRCGCEWTGGTSSQGVGTGYRTGAGSASSETYYEGTTSDNQTSRKMSMVVYGI